jgi:hypothetical protein
VYLFLAVGLSVIHRNFHYRISAALGGPGALDVLGSFWITLDMANPKQEFSFFFATEAFNDYWLFHGNPRPLPHIVPSAGPDDAPYIMRKSGVGPRPPARVRLI